MPESKVWLRFEGKKVNADGTRNKYKIVSVDNEELKNKILSYGTAFAREEPTNKALKTFDVYKDSIKLLIDVWIKLVDEGYSVACLTDDSESKFVGFNINFMQKGPKDTSFIPKEVLQGQIAISVRAVHELVNKVNMKKKFGVDRYLDAIGLYVIPEYRGDGIAKYLLEARKLVCKHHGIKVTANTFSSESARRVAEKVGFEVLSEMKMRDFETVYGLNVDCSEDDAIKFMGMIVE